MNNTQILRRILHRLFYEYGTLSRYDIKESLHSEMQEVVEICSIDDDLSPSTKKKLEDLVTEIYNIKHEEFDILSLIKKLIGLNSSKELRIDPAVEEIDEI